MPYVQISNPPIKLLIDTGCFTSIIKPSIIENYKPESIIHEPSSLKTSLGEKSIRYRATIPAFPDFKSDHQIEFLLFNFHEYFDGILGLKDLIAMNLSIDFKNQRLVNDSLEIPFYYRQPFENTFTFEISPNETLIKDYPVEISHGEIIIPESNINGLYIPETLTRANNYRAYFEIYNHNSKTISVSLEKPLPCIPVSNQYEFYHFDFSNDQAPPCLDKNIASLIRTNHMNSEEKDAIIKLCTKFQDIFHDENSKLTFTNEVKHEIRTTDDIPAHTKSYRFPYVHKPEVERQISKMLEDGIIRPSISP